VPISNRIDLLIELAVISLDHSDPDKALDLVNEAEEIVDSADWRPRFEIPLRARLAELRFNAGDEEQARADLREALAMFDDNRGKIVNIYRAGALRPIAEAYQATGEPAAAREIYMRTLEAGIENPNSRPRAEDLMATCCSMALHAVEPDSKLLSRIREIHDGLGDPW
jgi:tetratricopeptide (TPR) repeat protein